MKPNDYFAPSNGPPAGGEYGGDCNGGGGSYRQGVGAGREQNGLVMNNATTR